MVYTKSMQTFNVIRSRDTNPGFPAEVLLECRVCGVQEWYIEYVLPTCRQCTNNAEFFAMMRKLTTVIDTQPY